MNVAFPANRWRVAENLGHGADRGFDVRLSLLSVLECFLRIEGDRGQNRSRPGPKIFGAEIFAGNFAEVLIDVLRSDVADFAAIIEILKQILAGQILQLGNDFRDAPVGHIDFMLASALAAKTETQFRAFDLDMSIFHGREAERFVFARVLFVADANERPLEQLHDRRQYLVSWEPRQFQVPRNSSADFRQRFTEADYTIVFVFVANFAPALVIKILFATARISTGRLNVTVRQRRNPNFRPSRRNGETLDPQKSLLVTNQFPIRVEPLEIVAFCFSRVTGPIIADITQTGSLGCVHRLGDDLCTIALSIFCP